MSLIVSPAPSTPDVAAAVRDAREDRGFTVAALAERSGVSRAMIAKVERGHAQPTAALLCRLAGALGMTLSQLVARAERDDAALARAGEQPVWIDPATGYRRTALSPTPGGPIELVEVELPAGAAIGFPADAYLHHHHQVWVLDGELLLRDGEADRELLAGDCVALSTPADREYRTKKGCRYLVAVARRA